MQIIPMGEKSFREKFIQEHRARGEHKRIPTSIYIAKDGESVCILRAWLGNNVHEAIPWALVMEKIDKTLAGWYNSNPMIEGRKLIVQMIIGSFTQYLMQVQQIPKLIEAQIQKTICTFIWGDKKSPVKESMLMAPKELGGQGLLDIQARNKTIQVMWLKSYLNLGPSRVL